MANYEDRIKKEEEELEALEKAAKEAAEAANSGDDDDPDADNNTDGTTTTGDDNKDDGKTDDPEEESWKKRYGDLRRHQQQKEEEYKEELKVLKDEVESLKSSTTQPEIPEDIEELEEWKSKYPDIARIVSKLAEQMAEEKFKDAKFDLEELKLERRKAKDEKNIKIIKESHPDFDDLKESDDFQTWANEQPKWVQTALYEQKDDPRSVVRAIDLYKMDKGLTSADKSKKAKEDAKKAAAAVDTKDGKSSVNPESGKRKIKESWVDSLSLEEFAKHEPAIMEAQRTGNFIRDLSAR